MSLQATMELDSENESLQAQLAEAYSAALAEKDRELAELRSRLADAGNGGPPALNVLEGKTYWREKLSSHDRDPCGRCAPPQDPQPRRRDRAGSPINPTLRRHAGQNTGNELQGP
jgi:hypothetical protein